MKKKKLKNSEMLKIKKKKKIWMKDENSNIKRGLGKREKKKRG